MFFSDTIVNWYLSNKRDLPWRRTRDPYLIWLSEIILQQTRVDQGLPYYQRFSERFQNISDFANAEEGEVLRLWQGLGYYSRGRNMHKAARHILAEKEGIFPDTYQELLTLPGVGSYTAAAIASFAFDEAVAVLDGNVYRVLSRYLCLGIPINSPSAKKKFQEAADTLLNKNEPALHNQAIMEFGALLCKPKNPHCSICPLRIDCCAYKYGRVAELPVKQNKTTKKDRYFHYFIIQDQYGVLVNRRTGKDIWENLYEFPLLETTSMLDSEALLSHQGMVDLFGESFGLEHISTAPKHVLSHQNIYASFYRVHPEKVLADKRYKWDYVLLKDLDTLAKPKLIFTFIKDYISNGQLI